MHGVQDHLVVGVGVNGGHESLVNAERIVQHLDYGGDAVGGAGCVGDDVVVGRVIHRFVDTQDDGEVLTLGRGADDHLFGAAAVDVAAGLFGGGEQAGGLYDYLYAEVLPGDLGRVALGQDFDGPAVNRDGSVAGADVAGERAVVAVVLQQVGVCLGVGQVVDGYYLERVRVEVVDRLEYLAADASESVDAYLYCHLGCLLTQVAGRHPSVYRQANGEGKEREPAPIFVRPGSRGRQ